MGRVTAIRWSTWRPKLFAMLAAYDRHTLAADLTAGVTVGVVALQGHRRKPASTRQSSAGSSWRCSAGRVSR
jgi:hypothetical protein